MKQHRLIIPMVAACTAVLLFVVGCERGLDTSSPTAGAVQPFALSKQPSPVNIILETDNTFNSTGALSTNGTYVMEVDPRGFGAWGTTLHCPTILTDAHGTITIRLECRMVSTSPTTAGGPGNWSILSGTGAYANTRGQGTLTMDIDFVANTAVETLVGQIF